MEGSHGEGTGGVPSPEAMIAGAFAKGTAAPHVRILAGQNAMEMMWNHIVTVKSSRFPIIGENLH